MDVEYWRRRHAEQGKHYVARGGSRESYHHQITALSPYLLSWLPRGSVLDFGCGPRRFEQLVRNAGSDYVGYDQLTEFSDPGALLRKHDGVMAIFVLQHIVSTKKYTSAVRSIHKALSPGGSLFVVDHDVRHDMSRHINPRGPSGVLQCAEWSSHSLIGEYDGHWIGTFLK